jgi:hypothetical protein
MSLTFLRRHVGRFAGIALLVAGCAQNGPDTVPPDGSGGASGTGTGGKGTGGVETQGSGGSNGTGTGGQQEGSGGSNGGMGGAPGSGGGSGMGGRGTGGVTTGSGGRGTGGGSGPGTGGATGSGGGAIVISDIVPGLDGYYWDVEPSGNTSLSGTNYPFGPPSGGCPSTGTWDQQGYINTRPAINVKGTTGQKYTINMNVRGVVGTRCYTGGTAASNATPVGTGPNNTWYAGGKQFNDSIWNTMEIRVSPKVTGQANQTNAAYDVYYANSFPNVSNWCQKEATYEARYDASFPVMGGGTITFVVHDTNCRTLANCGPVEQQASCDTTASRVIDMSGLNPMPTSFSQPRTGSLGGTTYQIQWLWLDVTSITSP